jgi:hypothetical protein
MGWLKSYDTEKSLAGRRSTHVSFIYCFGVDIIQEHQRLEFQNCGVKVEHDAGYEGHR